MWGVVGVERRFVSSIKLLSLYFCYEIHTGRVVIPLVLTEEVGDHNMWVIKSDSCTTGIVIQFDV